MRMPSNGFSSPQSTWGQTKSPVPVWVTPAKDSINLPSEHFAQISAEKFAGTTVSPGKTIFTVTFDGLSAIMM